MVAQLETVSELADIYTTLDDRGKGMLLGWAEALNAVTQLLHQDDKKE